MPYKLVYFPIRGRGESTRLLCTDNGIELKEQFVTKEEWPELKTKLEFAMLPCLQDGDLEIVQPNAILRHLARKHGLYGSNDKEKTKIDIVHDVQEDVRVKYARLIYQKYETGKKDYLRLLVNDMDRFEKILKKNNGGKGFLVGDKISFTDYGMFDLLDIHLVLDPECLSEFPLLTDYWQRLSNREKIAKYRDSEDFKSRPINGNGKQ